MLYIADLLFKTTSIQVQSKQGILSALQRTQIFVASVALSFKNEGKEMNQSVKRTCRAIIAALVK